MQFFGPFGIASGGLGAAIGAYLVIAKVVAGLRGGAEAFRAYRIGTSPWLMLSVLLIVLGVQFFMMGLLGEMSTRTYHETQGKKIYEIRDVIESQEAGAKDG